MFFSQHRLFMEIENLLLPLFFIKNLTDGDILWKMENIGNIIKPKEPVKNKRNRRKTKKK